MIRYVAIGAVVGFVLSVLLLSRSEAPPVAAAALPPPGPEPTQVFRGPEGLRSRADLRIEDVTLRRAPNLLQHLEAPAVDAGG